VCLALGLGVSGVGGCASYSPPSFRITDVQLVERSTDAALIIFTIEGDNPNREQLPLDTVRYSMTLDGRAPFSAQRSAEATLPGWVESTSGKLYHDLSLTFVAPPAIDDGVRTALKALGASEVTMEQAERHATGTLIWLDAGPSGLPSSLANRPEQAQVVLLPGPSGTPSPGWGLADFVLPGDWLETATRMHTEAWGASLA